MQGCAGFPRRLCLRRARRWPENGEVDSDAITKQLLKSQEMKA